MDPQKIIEEQPNELTFEVSLPGQFLRDFDPRSLWPSLHGKDAMGSATASIHTRLRHSALLLWSQPSQISKRSNGTWKNILSHYVSIEV